jgi:hypothetical protein
MVPRLKVYAEFFEDGNLSYRKNTLLQFGESWKLIGNVVLANPGSAKPIAKIGTEGLNSIAQFYASYREGQPFKSANWQEFSPDATIRQIEKIFSGWYLGRNKELNGTIQLFNTLNIINTNLCEAVNQVELSSRHMYSPNCFRYFHSAATYFGFTKTILDHKVLSQVAQGIFESASEQVKKPYQPNFLENKFYHPGFVNRSYNQEFLKCYKQSVLEAMLG